MLAGDVITTMGLVWAGERGTCLPRFLGVGEKRHFVLPPHPHFSHGKIVFMYCQDLCKSKMKSFQIAHNSSSSTPESFITGFGPLHIGLMLLKKHCYFVIFVGTCHSWESNSIRFICIMGLFNILLC